MTESIMPDILSQYRGTHEYTVDLVETLTERQLAWTPGATPPSIGFHGWHMARRADYLQERTQHARYTVVRYEWMASDVSTVREALHLEKASLVGWSDGARTALVPASKAPIQAADRTKSTLKFCPSRSREGQNQIRVTPVYAYASFRKWTLGAPRTPAVSIADFSSGEWANF